MTDALWNGIIGAGGAAICCAVYFGFKAARKGISKIKFSKSQPMPEQKTEQPNNETTAASAPKQVTITLPTRKQIFTRNNVRAYCFIGIAIMCLVFADSIENYYHITGSGNWEVFEGDYYTNASSNLSHIADNTKGVFSLISECFTYLFYVLATLFGVLGLTALSFRK